MQAGTMPVNARALLRIQVSNLDFQAALYRFARQTPRERRFSHAAFL